MTKHPIPEWAKPGATVIFEPGSYRRDRTFYEVTITRVTKSSVFVKVGDRERRFVPSSWNNDADRMWAYGQRDSWSPSAYIWNPTCEGIAKALERNLVRAFELDVAKAARHLADLMASADRAGSDHSEAIADVRRAIEAYEAAK